MKLLILFLIPLVAWGFDPEPEKARTETFYQTLQRLDAYYGPPKTVVAPVETTTVVIDGMPYTATKTPEATYVSPQFPSLNEKRR